MFINNTNREYATWSREQLKAAAAYGEIVDMIMPGLAAEADEAEADRVAGLVVRRILRRLGREQQDRGSGTGENEKQDETPEGGTKENKKPDKTPEGGTKENEKPDKTSEGGGQSRSEDVVMCQGDFTLVYRVVKQLKDAGVSVVAPTFQRVTKPTLRPDGTTVPGYSFDFVRFRSY